MNPIEQLRKIAITFGISINDVGDFTDRIRQDGENAMNLYKEVFTNTERKKEIIEYLKIKYMPEIPQQNTSTLDMVTFPSGLGARDLSGKKVNYKLNPANACPSEMGLTIKSDFAFVLGGELCVWLEEKSCPVLLESLEPAQDEKRGYEWGKQS